MTVPRLTDRIRQTLEQEILTGSLAPGTRLDEMGLAERFRVSRTPVREALMQLSAGRLVELRPRQGAIVARIGTKRLVEMFEVMAELEALCAGLAARRMTPGERAALERLHRETDGALAHHDPDAYFALNRRFHEAIYAGSHNAFLHEQTRAISERLSAYRRVQLHRPGRMRESYREHEQVLRAIQAGDAAAASRLIKSHVTVQGDVFTDFLMQAPLAVEAGGEAPPGAPPARAASATAEPE